MFLGLLDPEDGGIVILGNTRNSSISDTSITSQNTIIFEFYASLYMTPITLKLCQMYSHLL
jgi:hypothetical protein